MILFSYSEQHILNLFKPGNSFVYQNELFQVLVSGKPTCSKGEPKTDIYIKAREFYGGATREFKISYKQKNADFLENKISEERARQLFGADWSNIIRKAILPLKNKFLKHPLIYKKSIRRTEEGSITLGWKFELVNKKSGDLSGELSLDSRQIRDVYAGTNLDAGKRNAYVNNRIIFNSGVANYFLFKDIESVESAQDVMDAITPIDEYVRSNPKIYFACKALNYRTKNVDALGRLNPKYDGDRPLSVCVYWTIEDGALYADLIFDEPLVYTGDAAYAQLRSALRKLGATNTDDLSVENVVSPAYIYE